VQANGLNIDEQLKTPLNQLGKNCLNYALIAAVESGSHSNVGKLILRGASNIDRALEESRRLKRYTVTAALLLIKAAMEDDRNLVLQLYAENVQGVDTIITLTEEDNLNELQRVVCNHTINTVVPIEIALKFRASAVREELLLRTHVNKNSGVVLWSGLHLANLEISWLQKIYWVKTIRLAQNEFTFLPSEIGSYLKQCTELDLQWNKIREIPHCLFELPCVSNLNLSHNNIIEIPDVPQWSTSLSAVDLSYNHLSTLPNSVVAPHLNELNISNNQFYYFPHSVCSFVGLTRLNIAYNSKIRTLPNELIWLKNLFDLNLNGLNSLIYPPKSACVTAVDCICFIKKHVRNVRGFYLVKLVVLGKYGVGKSTIVARLLGKEHKNVVPGGLNISKWKYSPSYNRKTFHFSIWDFDGQKEYYATYQCFLSQQSLYLLVWNITEGEAGIADLKPWLNNISVRAPYSYVIVVGTFLNKVSEEDRQSGKIDDLLQKVAELTAQYRELIVTKITAVGLQGQMENVQKLKDYIYDAAADYVMGAKIPSSYHALVDKLATIQQKLKDGEHEPIMHAAELKKLVRDLNLVDLQDNEELCIATQFLHEVGTLLHFDDRRHHLNDLYFVDPRWLYDIMSTVITYSQRNLYVNQGILRSSSILMLVKDKHFPTKYFQQYLALLNRFEIALPLDNDNRRLLIPSMLPEACPAIVNEQLSGVKFCYKRFITFHSVTFRGQSYCHPTPPGLWSRLLSRVMNNIKEVRDILGEQVPFENVGLTNTSVQDENSLMEVYNQRIFIKDGGALVHWCTGIFYNINGLLFTIKSLVENNGHNGIFIMSSPTNEGCEVFSKLIFLMEQLIFEWYPRFAGELDHKIPCHECIRAGYCNPHEFKVDQLLFLTSDHIECGLYHKVKLIDLAPDLFFDPALLLDYNKLIYKKEKQSLIGTGTLGVVYRGKYVDQSVAIKLYTAMEGIMVKEGFKELQSETIMLQQLCHPCVVCMVGVTVHPTILLVLEEAPLGTLQTQLLSEQQAFSRIVIYRIATQVASALHYLHTVNIILHSLKADNVLLWSLSPEHLINCKLTNFNKATHTDPGGSRGLYGNKSFVPPEVFCLSHAKERSVYDHTADIFSFGMFLYQLIAHRYPFHNLQPFKIEAAIEEGQRPQLEDIPVAESGLFYMTRIMKLCWAGSPDDRPKTQNTVKWLCSPALQLIMSVIPIPSSRKYSVCNGCIITPILSDEIGPIPTSSELWICCDGCEGTELIVFNTNTMGTVCKQFIREIQVQFMKQCGDYIWVASQAGLDYGVLNIFNQNTKDLIVHNAKVKGSFSGCIVNSDQLVYIGTTEGYCFAFPMDVLTIRNVIKPKFSYITKRGIDGLVITQSHLWVSSCNQIFFLNPNTLEVEGVEKRNKHACVGKMMLCDNGDEVWSTHLGGVIMSSWDAHQRVHLCDVDVSVIAEEKCHVGDPRDQIMTAMCTGLDTVWIGLASGHIIVFSMNPPGKVLTYFRPYHNYVRFLSAAKYPGPCGKEECMMLSGGKMYHHDNSFKELSDCSQKDRNGHPMGTAGVAILWEVLPAKYVRQVHYLRDGKAWMSYDRLKKAMIDTEFTESLKHYPSTK